LFLPKSNIWQEKAAEYWADKEFSAHGSKHCKNANLFKEKNVFQAGSCNLQLIVKIYGEQKHKVHKKH
jgi:hypothetical protein